MARKNIFEQLAGVFDYQNELQRIDTLLTDKKGISVNEGGCAKHYTVSVTQFVDDFAFSKWKNRSRCVDCRDMCEALDLLDFVDGVYDDPTEEEFLSYLEYAANILNLVQRVKSNNSFVFKCEKPYHMAKENVDICLNWLNFEAKDFDKQEKTLVVQKNAATTAVAELVDEELAYEIIHYNHYLLKGKVDSKKKILIKLGGDLEPRRAEIKSINKELEDSIFFMLNNLDLRHNNVSKNDKNYREFVANMEKDTLEGWYDELYQMILLAYLELDQKERILRVQELKNNI